MVEINPYTYSNQKNKQFFLISNAISDVEAKNNGDIHILKGFGFS